MVNICSEKTVFKNIFHFNEINASNHLRYVEVLIKILLLIFARHEMGDRGQIAQLHECEAVNNALSMDTT